MSNYNRVSAVMRELSGYVAAAIGRSLPDAVIERAKLHLVDTCAAMVSGTQLLPGARALAYVRTVGAHAEAGVMGTGLVTSAVYAAFANAMCGQADESDDVHPPTRTHPGTSIIPAALAMAERRQASGESLLRAIVLGYDICARTLYALKHEYLMRSWHHAGPKGGLFGSACAASALLGLSADQVRYVLAYCAQQTAGIYTMLHDIEHIEKAFAVGGMPARNGVETALMVEQGFTGAEDILSGEPNFMSSFSPQGDFNAWASNLGRTYEIMNCSIKYWPAGALIQAPLHVLHELIGEHSFGAADVQKIVVRIPDKDLKNVDQDMPDVSMPHLLSVMLIDGTITFTTSHEYERMKDPQVLDLRKRIETIGDPALTDPQRRWRCAMEVTLQDGRRLTHQTLVAKGSAENALTRAEQEDKALDLMGPVLGAERSRALIAGLFALDGMRDVRELRPLYAR